MSTTRETFFLRSLAYLGAAAKVHRLVHDFEDPQVRATLLQLASELEQDSKSWKFRAESLLEVGEHFPSDEDPEGRLQTVLPPRSDTDPPSPVPKTLPSEKMRAS